MIVEGGGMTEKNPTSKMVTGSVLNVEIITSLGERIAIAAMHPRAMREATVVHVVIIGVVTEEVVDSAEIIVVATEEVVDSAETIGVATEEAVDNAETIGVATEEAVVDSEVAEIVEIIVVETDVEAAEGTEAVDNAGTTVVVAAEMEDSAEMTETVDARIIANNDRVMTDHHDENTRAAMNASQSDETHEAPVGGAQKARAEIDDAEISRGVFI
tara:strand:- start:17852 stop:18496 length:645 start_codon:yes stop_codon:yes gene_type:complete